jgi:hypothetical protein
LIPVEEWLPDLPSLAASGEALNVIPDSLGYRPLPSLGVYSNALTGRCIGFAGFKSKAGVAYDIAASGTSSSISASSLYQLGDVSWTDVSKGGGTYTTSANAFWEFAQWGDWLLAVNGTTAPQRLSLGASAAVDLGGSPPAASHIAIVRNFVVLGNISGSPQSVQWSGIEAPETWTGDQTNLADSQELVGDHGQVQKVIGGEYGLIFMERAVYRMTYAGLPYIFQFDKLGSPVGALAPQSVVNVGQRVWFLSENGFYYHNGVEETPIGRGKVDRYFLGDLSEANAHRVFGAADPRNQIVVWLYPSNSSANGSPDSLIIYNWALDKWSRGEVDAEILARFLTPGYTLDGLDSFSSSLDTLPASLDDPAWMGGRMSFAAFDTSHRLSTFTGTALDATVDTKEIEPVVGSRAHCRSVRPIVDGGTTVSVKVGYRNLPTETPTFNAMVAVNSAGECPVRINARYQRYRIETSGDYNFIIGARPTVVPEGTR